MFNSSLRYFVIDFKEAFVVLYKSKKEREKKKVLSFRKITECRTPNDNEIE